MSRRFRPRRTWRFWTMCLFALLMVARLAWVTERESPPRNLAEGMYHVRWVIDGDTLVLDDGIKVRLIGVDTPETRKRNTPVQPWGPEAEDFTRAWIKTAGNNVRLQFDDEWLDQYGRHLAYVWSGERMLNEELIRAGLGKFEAHFRYSETMKRRFRLAQREAQSHRVGIWLGKK